MSNEIKGTIHQIFNRVQVTDRFAKREFILKVTDGNYDQYLKFQMTNDNGDVLDSFKINQVVTVSYNLRGRLYMKDGAEQCFTTLEAWKVLGEGVAAKVVAVVKQVVGISKSDEDQLPF